MFLSAQTASDGQIAFPVSKALSPEDLAALWQGGKSVSISGGKVHRQTSLSTDSLSGFVFVRVPLLRFSASQAQRADFTNRYCSVMVASIAASGEALLAFKLPEPLNGKVLNALLRGLDVTYGGKAAGLTRETEFGFTVDGERQVLIARNRELDEAAVNRLMLLGRENSALQMGHTGYIRSGVTVAPDSVVTLENGESQVLARLEPDTAIFCPVHVDSRATAFVQVFAVGGAVVQCDHCQRVFPGRASRPSYDFGLFDRTVERLARELPAEVTRNGLVYDEERSIFFHSERYLPTLELAPGITFVKSPKGSGKTEELVKVVRQCEKQQLTVLVIGHRRSLLQSLAHRLKVDNYRIPRPRAIGSDVDEYLAVQPRPYYAVCLDSLGRLNPKTDRYDVVIIDESEQVFAHLIGETVREERRAVFARLKFYLDKAKHVFCLDADLNMISMQAAFVMMRPETSVRIVINEPETESRPYHLCGTKAQLIDEMLGDVRRGYKCFVATNSKRQAQDLETMLVREFPGRRIVTVTSDNSQSRDVQQLLSAIADKFRNEIDVLIASPAMGTGVDITFRDADGNPEAVVDRMFGLFEANITTHFDLDQHLMRVRHPGQVKVWVNRTELNYETDVACLIGELKRSLDRTDLRTHSDPFPRAQCAHRASTPWHRDPRPTRNRQLLRDASLSNLKARRAAPHPHTCVPLPPNESNAR